MQPIGVVAGCDEQRRGGVDSDAVEGEQRWRGLFDETGKGVVDACHLDVDVLDTLGEVADHDVGRIRPRVVSFAGFIRAASVTSPVLYRSLYRTRISSGAQMTSCRSWFNVAIRC